MRYLRNCVIAKIAGIGPDGAGLDGPGGELLQISADEQRRAARSAALFTEEELTRFLQVMLRTFDELGYRQEQRFHFELGLLKLVHLRRLLPVEDILSRFPVPGGPDAVLSLHGHGRRRPGFGTSSFGASQRAAASCSLTNAVSGEACFFSLQRQYRSQVPKAISESPAPAIFTPPAPKAVIEIPKPAVVAVLQPEEQPFVAPPIVEEAALPVAEVVVPPPAPEPIAAAPVEAPVALPPAAPSVSVDGQSADELQRVVVEALSAAKSQGSAADAIADAEWKIEAGEIKVQTGLSKTMLPMVVNADADRIIRAALRTAGAGSLKLSILSGSASSTPKKAKPARTGSAQARALEHPVVQQAQRLFNAEIRNVIDLRDND